VIETSLARAFKDMEYSAVSTIHTRNQLGQTRLLAGAVFAQGGTSACLSRIPIRESIRRAS
jgi:hypothetical protein